VTKAKSSKASVSHELLKDHFLLEKSEDMEVVDHYASLPSMKKKIPPPSYQYAMYSLTNQGGSHGAPSKRPPREVSL
jgi:hypothetical protein